LVPGSCLWLRFAYLRSSAPGVVEAVHGHFYYLFGLWSCHTYMISVVRLMQEVLERQRAHHLLGRKETMGDAYWGKLTTERDGRSAALASTAKTTS